MHFTKRLRDRGSSGALVVAAILAAGSAAASCSNDDVMGFDASDAASDGEPPTSIDAAPNDADRPARDAGPFDAAALPVVCESSSCATSLTASAGLEWQSSLPVRVTDRYGRYRGETFCALLHDGTVACWGDNEIGQLGRGDDAGTAASGTPARVVGLSDIVSISGTCAIDRSGGAWCWGAGAYLQSDAAAATVELSPVKLPIPPATKVSTTTHDGCAVVDSGVLCWGLNTYGQVTSPVGWNPTGLPPKAISIPPGAPIRDLLVGHASFLVREDGAVLSWGTNPPLGRITSLSPDSHPAPVALAGISAIDVAVDNVCAISEGIAYCWGVALPDPADVQANMSLDRALPEPVVTPEPVVHIATTGHNFVADQAMPQRWCAVGGSGAVYCWGNNASGQAGDGTKNYALRAVKVDLPSPAAQVKTTGNTTCALLTSGKVYCWGSNGYGQLGTGVLKQGSVVPQEVILP